ncbi:putative sulfate exporter family transporter [Sandarakinorhabdus sp.]|uniref:YeiH family protein n=1 Tax=Sandarakinorhabdus sp. TaxID=1916663 RepID=UPI00286E252A|nr:putative sulfate exporter family transporter [Sandarakinorhabdus sp.]
MSLPQPQAADLFGDIESTPKVRFQDYLPGLTIAVLATLAAASLSDRYGAPLTLMALLIGLALNFLSADRRLTPGLTLASRELLRWAIVLVGARITFAQILALGPESLLAVVAIVAITIGSGVIAARLLGFTSAFGVLSSGAVAICGASAAMALAATLGERRIRQAELTLVLVGTSTMSSVALVVYPMIAHLFDFNDVQAGFFLGASIHDVAQTLGAGYAFSPGAGETATIVKLARVALLAPVLALVAVTFPAAFKITGGKRAAPLLPWFVAGFFVVAAINSTGIIPAVMSGAAAQASAAMLAVSVAATAIRSPLAEIMKAGPKPLLIGAIASIASMAAALGFAALRL